MIARVRGALVTRELDRIEVFTPGGVAYEIAIPLTVFERLPPLNDEIELRIFHLIREDGQQLFGFLTGSERVVFGRLLGAQGVGPKLALAMLSALPADRLTRAIRERDVPTLTGISGVGKKTAERLVLDLAGKLDDIRFGGGPADVRAQSPAVEEAVRALVVLGTAVPDAERAVRQVLDAHGIKPAAELIRLALAETK